MERFGPTRRGGPVFRWLGEPLAIDLANTVMVVREGKTVDLLGSADELENWLELERPGWEIAASPAPTWWSCGAPEKTFGSSSPLRRGAKPLPVLRSSA